MGQNIQEMNEKKARISKKKIRRHLLSFVLLLILLFAVMLEYLTLTEYRPAATDYLGLEDAGSDPVSRGESLRILTWNCGYGAMGDNADYFMDGGKSVRPSDKERVRSNLSGIAELSAQMDPDVMLYQEIDDDAARSFRIDETITLTNDLLCGGNTYSSVFAPNLDVRFIPYPFPPIGHVRSGLLSMTEPLTESAVRIQLPCSFRWPGRLANYKRCLLLERLPVEDSDKELVIINLQLEVYDDGEGRKEQTQKLLEIMKEEAGKGNYVIAGGDFSQTFSSTDVSAYPLQESTWQPGTVDVDSFGEGWQFIMDSSTPTCRSADRPYEGADKENFRYYVIDGFIVSDNIEVTSCKTQDEEFVFSDHNPVLLECILK